MAEITAPRFSASSRPLQVLGSTGSMDATSGEGAGAPTIADYSYPFLFCIPDAQTVLKGTKEKIPNTTSLGPRQESKITNVPTKEERYRGH